MVFSKYNRRRFEGEKPVKEGDAYDIDIEATGAKGDGIGKVKGFVVIIPNAKPGQKLKVKIDAVRGKVAFGTIVGEASAAPAKSAEDSDEAQEDELQEEADEDEDSEEEAEADSEPAKEKGKKTEEDSSEETSEDSSEEDSSDEEPEEESEDSSEEDEDSEEDESKTAE